MKREKVISILHYYRDIPKNIKLNERVIKNLEDQYYNTLGGMKMDGMPRAKGGTSSPVENVVLNVPRSVVKTIEEIRRDNARMEQIRGEILSELNRLAFSEKAVVLGFYIDGQQWEQISEQVNYSPRQCRNIRAAALDHLAERFARNKAISRYQFPRK